MSATAIFATWVWEEVSAGSWWLNLIATLKDEQGKGVANKVINVSSGVVFLGTITTDYQGVGSRYYAPVGEWVGTKTFSFNFGGDSTYNASTASISVEYRVDPPPPSTSALPLILMGVIGYMVFTSYK